MSKKRRRRSGIFSRRSEAKTENRQEKALTTTLDGKIEGESGTGQATNLDGDGHKLYALLHQVSELTEIPVNHLATLVSEAQEELYGDNDGWNIDEDDDPDQPEFLGLTPWTPAWNAIWERADEALRDQMRLYIQVLKDQKAYGQGNGSTTSDQKNGTSTNGQGKIGFTAPTMPKKKKTWDAEGPKCISACGVAGEPVVTFSYEAWAKVNALMDHYHNLEWLAYLVGEKKADRFEWYISDLRIPVQEVEPAHVEVIEKNPNLEGVVGVCHSHNTMGAFFSGEDDEFINANHPLSIVFSKKTGGNIEYKMNARTEVRCGEILEVEGGKLYFEKNQSATSWVNEVKPAIKEKMVPSRYGNYYNGWDDDDENQWWMKSDYHPTTTTFSGKLDKEIGEIKRSRNGWDIIKDGKVVFSAPTETWARQERERLYRAAASNGAGKGSEDRQEETVKA